MPNQSKEAISRQGADQRAEIVSRSVDLLTNTMEYLGYSTTQPETDQVPDYKPEETKDFDHVQYVIDLANKAGFESGASDV